METSIVNYSEVNSSTNSDIYINNRIIPPQILSEILIRINCPKTIGYICPLVCKRWYEVLLSSGFWINYMKYWSLNMPPNRIRNEEYINIKKIALKQPYGRNLINNPSGEHGFNGWNIRANGGDGFLIEKPPFGCTPNEDIQIAFVTSFYWCKKYYVVDLWNEGIEGIILDKYHPTIIVSEWFNCREDCASTYIFDVKLIQNGKNVTIDTVRPPMMPSEDEWSDNEFENANNSANGPKTNLTISRIFDFHQWSDAVWQRIEHKFICYPPGIRYVLFEHSGRDLQFWAGHYGAKMAKASIVVSFDDEISNDQMESDAM